MAQSLDYLKNCPLCDNTIIRFEKNEKARDWSGLVLDDQTRDARVNQALWVGLSQASDDSSFGEAS